MERNKKGNKQHKKFHTYLGETYQKGNKHHKKKNLHIIFIEFQHMVSASNNCSLYHQTKTSIGF